MNFQIETTSFCDLTCPECPNYQMGRKRAMMSPDVWETILRKYVIPYRHINAHLNRPTLIPNKDGEPLLNKRLPALLQKSAEFVPDMALSIYSHGLMLTLDFIEFLNRLPNPVRLLVSFHFYNHDGSQNDYARTTALLRHVFSNPKHENIEFILVSHVIGVMTEEKLLAWKETWRHFIDTGRVTVHANAAINPWTGLISAPGLSHHNGCPYSNFGAMFFGATGNVIACCMDLEEEIVFGNVMRDDPQAMFETVGEFYAAQARREVKHAACHDCFGLPPAPRPLLQLGVPA